MSKMAKHIKPSPILVCLQCGQEMERKRDSAGRLQDLALFMKRKYCSKDCKDKSLIKEIVNKGGWRWRARLQRKTSCELCESQKNLQVHHKNKILSDNAPENLQTLCASCHNTLHWKERKENGLAV